MTVQGDSVILDKINHEQCYPVVLEENVVIEPRSTVTVPVNTDTEKCLLVTVRTYDFSEHYSIPSSILKKAKDILNITNTSLKRLYWHKGRILARAVGVNILQLRDIPLLSVYNPNLETELHTDASSKGIASILLQKHGDSFKLVMYYSRMINKNEKVYHSYELETLAIVESIKRFRIYLTGFHFAIITDCAAVRSTFSKRDLLPRVARWWLAIQDFDFEIKHRPGEKNEAPDGNKLVIAKSARFNILRKYHDDIGHTGLRKCDTLIKSKFWFQGMKRFIKKYVKNCLDCAYKRNQYGKREGFLYLIDKNVYLALI
nr:unnamed protein product [Callosobruchus analis]